MTQPSASNPATPPVTLPGGVAPRNRVLAVDWQWNTDASNTQFRDHVFTRSSAKRRTFVNVDFRYSTFDAAYFRSCTFDSCDFTGCRFIGTNFHGSSFTGCTFDYAVFERTLIDNAILDTGCPALENLKLRFARTLRTNFQALGDAASVNKAILVELDATAIHLHKAWASNESYYRKKYGGWHRFGAFFDWASFKSLDLLWGNGERPGKLARFICILMLVIAAADVMFHRDPRIVASYGSALLMAPQVFLATTASPFGGLATVAIAFARLVIFGLFISILVRRFARR